ncbi:hypothetical protein CWE09_02715 [Aliidiomarina minuta]|uniref:Uncharacterized protein n=1 Tax=Aliidiomarina minuta TaxID=880057 RepID=A0A432W6F4_9GAMM|nr:hypothetical protein [Aliidiomarina minuta]RUO25658.1 hypothetical protein CWE09_02715 [Aliidiomarina minuta]
MTTTKSASLRTLNKVLGTLSIIGWVFYIAALSVFHFARPDPDNIYDSIFGLSVQTEWNPTLGGLFFALLSIGLLLSLIALALNIYLYSERRTHVWINLMILILASLGTGLYFLLSIR